MTLRQCQSVPLILACARGSALGRELRFDPAKVNVRFLLSFTP